MKSVLRRVGVTNDAAQWKYRGALLTPVAQLDQLHWGMERDEICSDLRRWGGFISFHRFLQYLISSTSPLEALIVDWCLSTDVQRESFCCVSKFLLLEGVRMKIWGEKVHRAFLLGHIALNDEYFKMHKCFRHPDWGQTVPESFRLKRNVGD